eukprot:1510185-Pyramimonas_sp.AAC.1
MVGRTAVWSIGPLILPCVEGDDEVVSSDNPQLAQRWPQTNLPFISGIASDIGNLLGSVIDGENAFPVLKIRDEVEKLMDERLKEEVVSKPFNSCAVQKQSYS